MPGKKDRQHSNKREINMFFSLGKFVLAYFCIILMPLAAFSQNQNYSVPARMDKAQRYFISGEFKDALYLYTDLLKRYPRDAEINFHTGVCMVKTNTNIPEAINCLRYASAQSAIPNAVHYYLSEACLKNYEFGKAREAWSNYNKLATNKEKKDLQTENLVARLNTVADLTAEYYPVEIKASALFSFFDSEGYQQVTNNRFILSKKNSCFEALVGMREDMASFMFCPENIGTGDYLYFASYDKRKRENSDIFRVRKLWGNNWDMPEKIEICSSPQDEILPCFDYENNILYFASKGHEGMGGFDIFRSAYDMRKKTWSEPENVGFPINTPANEYLFFPEYLKNSWILITDRLGMDSMLVLYRLTMEKQICKAENEDPLLLQNLASLGGIQAIPEILDLKTEFFSQNTVAGIDDKKENRVVAIATALELQKKSDSLTLLSKEAKKSFLSTNSQDEKWKQQKRILKWQKLSAYYQSEADFIFRELETAQQASEKKNIPTGKKAKANTSGLLPPLAKAENLKILKKCPYTETNPFPRIETRVEGIVYSIQIGVYKNTIAWNSFKGASPVYTEYDEKQRLNRYYAGRFPSYKEAKNEIARVRQEIASDAFVVGWIDGKKTKTEKLIHLEKKRASQN